MTETRNVIDYYAAWETVAIRDDLDSKRSPLVNVCMNLTNDFNKSTVIRNNNAFCGRKVVLVGKRRLDKRGTVGTHHYEYIEHSIDIAPVITALKDEGYIVYAVDNIEGYEPQCVYDADLPEKTAFIYGEEMLGLSADVIEMCDGMLYIPQQGSVRSLNVGTVSGIMMSEYARRHRS